MKLTLINSTKNAFNAVKKSLSDLDIEISSLNGFDGTLEFIKKNKTEIVLINWGKENHDIAKLCRDIRKSNKTKYAYILVIASRERQTEMQEVLEAGSDNFIFRPFGEIELALRVKMAEKVISLEGDLVTSKKRLMKLAKEDPLTNLLNRRSLLDEAIKEMGRSAREMKYMSSILIEINNLKEIIDKYGSDTGNGVLLDLSNRFKLESRPYDKIGRYGISQFLLILPDSGIVNAKKVAKRILDEAKKPFHIKGNDITITLSIGISEINPADVTRLKENQADDILIEDLLLDSLIKRSETALIKAGEKGGNPIEVAAT